MLIRAIKRAQLVLSVVVIHCLVSFNGAAGQDFDLSTVAVNVNGEVNINVCSWHDNVNVIVNDGGQC